MENDNKSIVTAVLLGLSLLTALGLESRMSEGIAAELTVIFLGSLFSGAILFGLLTRKQWAYPLSALLFVLFLANLLWLFISTRELLGFAFGILVNIAGIIVCLMSMEYGRSFGLETYNIESYGLEPLKRKRGRPPKKEVYANF